MTPLATIDDFLSRLSQLEVEDLSNIDNPTTATVNADKIGKALDDATTIFYVRSGFTEDRMTDTLRSYALPLVIDIARYRMDIWSNREDVRQRYEDALKACAMFSGFGEPAQGGSGELVDPIMTIMTI